MTKLSIQMQSKKVAEIRESTIREMSRLAVKHGAVNLGQGIPDFPCPPELKEAAKEAIFADINQYPITFGDKHLRDAVAKKYSPLLEQGLDPETNITITCGATEALMATLLACLDTGDEVIVFEPFYENYLPQITLAGGVIRYVPLQPPQWQFDPKQLSAAFNNKTRAIIINTPQNPTGRVFNSEELTLIGQLCHKWGVLAITDEVYEHIIFDNALHVYPAGLPDMADITVTISGISKTYNVTGWRVSWAIANKQITNSIRKVHDYLTIAAPAPLQRAAVKAVSFGADYYTYLAQEYEQRRQYMFDTLDHIGVPYFKPQGAYYIFADISKYGYKNNQDFLRYMLETVGVAIVPGASFFSPDNPYVNSYARFCFSRKPETLEAAREKLWRALK